MKTANFNNKLFDSLNEKSAYVLGFWYADGYIGLNRFIDKNGRPRVYKKFNITNTDKQIMDDIAAVMGIKYNTVLAHDNYSECYRINSANEHHFDYCFNQVKSTDKTNNAAFPSISDDLMRHFVRGYFDGDGSIYIKKYKSRHGGDVENLNTTFTASKNSWLFLNDLKQVLIKHIGISDNKIIMYSHNRKSKDGDTGSSKLVFTQYDSGLLCEWIYKDATIFMKRKKKIWDDFDKVKLMNSTKFFSGKKKLDLPMPLASTSISQL